MTLQGGEKNTGDPRMVMDDVERMAGHELVAAAMQLAREVVGDMLGPAVSVRRHGVPRAHDHSDPQGTHIPTTPRWERGTSRWISPVPGPSMVEYRGLPQLTRARRHPACTSHPPCARRARAPRDRRRAACAASAPDTTPA